MTQNLRLRSPGWALCAIFAFTLALAACGGSSPSPSTPANPVGSNLVEISSDAFTVAPGQHATEVEPHVVSHGPTMVAAFQVGRIPQNAGVGGGATDIGWATSTGGGATWTRG